MNLTLRNLTNEQVINILGEIASSSEMAKIVQERMKNPEMTSDQVIERLLKVCGDHL